MKKVIFGSMLLVACKDVANPTETNDQEFITAVEVTIDGTAYTWSDPELDGTPEVDPIFVSLGQHAVSVRFLNTLEDPPEDITVEVRAEATEHQVFWETPDQVVFTYGDQDANGLPIGLEGTLTANDVSTGPLVVTLRHLPEESGGALKVSGLEDLVASGGIDAIPGDSDARVEFPFDVEE